MCHSKHVEVRGQPRGAGALFPTLPLFWGVSPGLQACVAKAFTDGPFCPPSTFILETGSLAKPEVH